MIQPRSPNGTRRPIRSVRVGDDVWDPAKAKAEKRGETLADVIVRALKEYASDDTDSLEGAGDRTASQGE